MTTNTAIVDFRTVPPNLVVSGRKSESGDETRHRWRAWPSVSDLQGSYPAIKETTMLRYTAAGCAWAAILGLSTPAAILALQGKPGFASAQPQTIEIPDPGKSGLKPGRYRLALGSTPSGENVAVILSLAPSGAPHKYTGRMTGCDLGKLATTRWISTVTPRSDGSLRLDLVATSPRSCRIVAAIPAAPVPGIEGTPIGTAGAPSQKAPGIEGSPIGTAGAPGRRGAGGVTGSADREVELLIEKARQALPRLACARDESAQAQIAPVRAALQQVARASSAAAAVQPLRRFEAARVAIEEILIQDRGFARDARVCADAYRRCTATGSAGRGCGIDEALCLARVRCGAD
jgi:hypothetical protein